MTLRPFQDTAPHGHMDQGEPDQMPCAFCQRPVKLHRATRWLRIIAGGARFATVSEQDIDEAADMGHWPVGPRCWRKHRNAVAELQLTVTINP